MTYKDLKNIFNGMNIPFSNLMHKLLHKIDTDITKINKDLDDKVNKEDIDIDSIVEQSIPTVIEQAIPKVAEEIVPTLDDRYVQFDKKYPKLTAGFAENLISDDSSTEEEFVFRPTAGEERNVVNTTYYNGERNGVARIAKIKGNSVVYNQGLTFALDQTAKNGWWFRDIDSGGNPRIEGNKICYEVLQAKGSTQQISQFHTIISGHKYLVHFWYNTNGVINDNYGRVWRFSFSEGLSGGTTQTIFAEQNSITIGTINLFITANNDYDAVILKEPYILNQPIQEHIMEWADIWIIDLTKMFGAGNEPTTIEEFYQRLPKGIDLSKYNTGTIIDGNYGGIKTVGFNAFNGTYAKVCAGLSYYLGGNYTSLKFTTDSVNFEDIIQPTSIESVGTTPNDRLYTPSQNGYIYAEGENININISWGIEYGYLNGTYQPYKPFNRDLSWIRKYFPNGMRSAGSVRDEFRFNSTTQKWEAVQNVGVVDLGSLRWFLTQREYNGVVVNCFNAYISNGVASYNGNDSNVLYNRYKRRHGSAVGLYDGSYGAEYVNENYPCLIKISDNSFSDIETFKANVDGTFIYYPLAEHIVVEITENINMDFDVYDYGTEELITSEDLPSAPLKADIIYSLDAFYTLKNVPDILKDIKLLKSELENLKNANSNIEE